MHNVHRSNEVPVIRHSVLWKFACQNKSSCRETNQNLTDLIEALRRSNWKIGTLTSKAQ